MYKHIHMNDLVSIIMPSYNCGKYVEETIRSVEAQTYHNWEIIFVDDCSTDDTIAKVKSLQEEDKRIRLYSNELNSGAAVSRNFALREAKGRWIAFLDSDDLWEPKKLEKQIRFMEENGYAFSYSQYTEIDDNSKEMGLLVSGPKHITKNIMYCFCWPGCLTVMYDRNKIGLIQIEDIKKNNDYEMWLTISKRADCYLLEEVLAKYRRGRKGSISTHNYATLIKWHYKLFHDAEKMNAIVSTFMTGVNIVCGLYKKVKYVRKI